FADFKELLFALHEPVDIDEASEAKAALQVIAAYQALQEGIKSAERPAHPKTAMPASVARIEPLMRALPFPMTDDQIRAAKDIVGDLTKTTPMHRLLSGDVGCGKTVSYLLPAVAAQAAGRQVVILMPN